MSPPDPTPNDPATDATRRARACEVFLRELATSANVTGSAMAAGVHRATVYRWREEDAAFAAAWDDAVEQATDALEAEMRRRAFEGCLRPVFQGGVKVGEIREYSDRLAEVLLKGHRPKFRENAKVEISGPGGGPVRQEVRHGIDDAQYADLVRLALGPLGFAANGAAGRPPAPADGGAAEGP